MNELLRHADPVFKRLARLGKAGLFLTIVLYVLCYIALYMNGGDSAKLMQTAGPAMMGMAVLAVVGELGGSMVRTHLDQVAARKAGR